MIHNNQIVFYGILCGRVFCNLDFTDPPKFFSLAGKQHLPYFGGRGGGGGRQGLGGGRGGDL